MTREEIYGLNKNYGSMLKHHEFAVQHTNGTPDCPSKPIICPMNAPEKVSILKGRMAVINLAKMQMRDLIKNSSDFSDYLTQNNGDATKKLKKYLIVTAGISLWTLLLLTSAYIGATVCSPTTYLVNDDEDVYISSVF